MNTAKILVTLSGECFRVRYESVGNADDRDGVLYYFKLEDLLKDRGVRSISLFRSGMDRGFVPDYDSRIETVRLNVLRRAFDSGSFTFETSIPPGRYHELPLRATDFQPQKRADDDTIQRFIKFGAYWIGFKHSLGADSYVDFGCAEDLEYLGVRSEDIGRNVRLLTEEGYLRSSVAGLANSLKVSPTKDLIREIGRGSSALPPTGAAVTQTFHIYGDNARVNTNSTDNSINVVSVSGDELFVQLREKVSSIPDESERSEILAKLDELQQARGSGGFMQAYQNFIVSAAQYMTIIGPFIPALTQMLSGR